MDTRSIRTLPVETASANTFESSSDTFFLNNTSVKEEKKRASVKAQTVCHVP